MPTTTKTVEGVAVHTSGDGPGLVLLHANGGDATDFAAVHDHLAADHTVHAIDWPGWGASPAHEPPTAVGYASLLPRVLRALGAGPFVLIGNSVGGFAAIRTAAEHPELVRALVLIDPGGFTARWPGSVLACRAIGSRRLAPTMMRTLPRLYLRRATAAVRAIRSHAIDLSHTQERVDAFASVWRSFADRDHDARPDAARVAAPTLLIWGRRDPVLPWPTDGRRARRALAEAEFVAFPCGHQAFAEMPDEFLAAIDPFLDRISSETP
ncbi:MAG: hypothetical protein RL531_1346 [Actinomycetota bacterium]|jgi:pimeloyl-ACP methyl ester carboxylesterase